MIGIAIRIGNSVFDFGRDVTSVNIAWSVRWVTGVHSFRARRPTKRSSSVRVDVRGVWIVGIVHTVCITVEAERFAGSRQKVKVTEAEAVYVAIDDERRPVPIAAR